MVYVQGTIFLITLWSIVAVCLACNGYKLKVKEIKNCGDDKPVVKLSNDFTVEMDKDCNIAAKGCATVRAFSKAIGKYKLIKPPFPPIAGEIDLCEAAEKYGELIDPFFEALALPKRCPVNAMEHCMDGTKKINISKYKSRLSMVAGKLDATLNVTHDTGITCVRVNLEIARPKRKL